MVSVISQSPITTSTRTRERLVYFVVSDDGVLIALYNDNDRAVIRMKDVTADHYTDWRLNVRSTVRLPHRRRLRRDINPSIFQDTGANA